jgi:tetratricopeptide (TPR) repeat protein
MRYKRLLVLCVLLAAVLYALPQPDSDKTARLVQSGLAAMSRGEYQQALDYIDQALKADPKNAELYRLKGQLLETLKCPREAITAWKSCLANTRNDTLIREAKQHIDNLQE